ncbi:hypothetical protein [Cellulosimicrobium sp. CUA-896]|uniref:hypothetical protein n=1 Tax=Cellulosimicrobium sp. CUA-896 TaxID=1517881 RepID=UPI0035166658
MTASPLVLEQVDEVLLLEGGRVTARGTHRDLVARGHAEGVAPDDDAARYLRVVGRSLDDAPPPVLAATTGTTPVPEGEHA